MIKVKSYASKFVAFLGLVLVFLISFAGVASATAMVDGGSGGSGIEELVGLGRPVLDAVLSGHPGLAAALALVFLAAVARRYAAKRFRFFATDAGGAVIVLVGAFGGAAASLITGGATWGLALVWKALTVAFGAAGGYSIVKRLLVEPVLRPLFNKIAAKYPWLGPVFDVALWFFAKPDPIAKAEAAGQAAVEAKPSTGAAGVVGTATEVE